MSEINRANLRKLAETATPGPWRGDGNHPRKIRDSDGDTFATVIDPNWDEVARGELSA